MNPSNSFPSLIHPMKEGDFFSSYWSKDFCHIKGNKDKFSHLLNWETINHLLKFQRFTSPRFRLIKEEEVISPELFYRNNANGFAPHNILDDISPIKVNDIMAEGSTIAINSLQEIVPEIFRLENSLQWYFQDHVNINMYIGCKQSKAFRVHWDPHDVMVLQVIGRKNWKVYGNTSDFPFDESLAYTDPPTTDPKWQGNLEEGDFLYLPRGCWHVANSIGEPTVHLTIGIKKRKGSDYLKWIIENFSDQILEFRKDVPRLESDADQSSYLVDITKALHGLINKDTLKEYFEHTNLTYPAPKSFSFPFTIDGTQEITERHAFITNSKRPPSIRANKDEILIFLHKKEFSFHPNIYKSITKAISGDKFSLSDITELGELDNADSLAFLKELLSLNIITFY